MSAQDSALQWCVTHFIPVNEERDDFLDWLYQKGSEKNKMCCIAAESEPVSR